VHLKARDIQSVFHYLPLHLSDMGRNFGGTEGLCPLTEAVSERLLRLPFYNELTEAHQERIVLAIEEFKG
jgi:dTDP-4-amino-4,6-dideoxygalactose transaminase